MKLYKTLSSATNNIEEVRALKLNIKSETFPSELLKLEHLEELYLDGNCKEFPHNPGWRNLKVLSIKWPKFEGNFSDLFILPALENLKIIETPIKQFLLPLGEVGSPLKSLTMKDCGLEKLPEEISMLVHLKEMNLSGNNLAYLPYSFKELSGLTRLNLDQNLFSVFPEALGSMPNLKHLSLDLNAFSEEEKSRIQRDHHIWIN